MKRFLTLVLFASVALSCGKDKVNESDTPSGGGGNTALTDVEITEFIVEDMSIIEDGDPVDIPVKTVPDNAVLTEHARVIVEQGESLMEYSVNAHSIHLAPKDKGTVVFMLKPKFGPGSSKKLTVTIGAAIASVAINSPRISGDKTINMSSAESLQLGTTIKNTSGQTVNTPVKWSVESGSEYVSISSDGLLKGVKGGGSAVVRVEIAQKPSIFDRVNVNVSYAPENLVISSGDKELEVLSGSAVAFKVRVEPAEASQVITLNPPTNYKQYFSYVGNQLTNSDYSREVVITAKLSSPQPFDIEVATIDGSKKKTVRLYINDYNDMTPKPGDYVYYKASNENTANGPFILYDCGRRCQNRFEGGAKKARPSNSGEVFIGVLATVGKPASSTDFLGNKIYKTSSMIAESSLVGASYVNGNKTHIHGLVLAAGECANKVAFCPNNEACASDAFLADRYAGFSSNKFGYARYCALRDVYNTNANYVSKRIEVIPEVENYNSAHQTGKRGTQWFIPGKADIEFISDPYCALSLDNPLCFENKPRYCCTAYGAYNGYYMEDWRLTPKSDDPNTYIVMFNYSSKNHANFPVWPVMWL